MRIVKNLAAVAAALMLAVSLAGCQLASDAVNGALDQARQLELDENQAGAASADAPTAVRVLRVVDGDTIAVAPDANFPATNDSGTEHVVRMLGIDTAEMNKMKNEPAECGAQAALDHLAGILAGSDTVTLSFDSQADRTDRYGRSLAYVQLADGTDAAQRMTADGFAKAWFPFGEPEPERFGAYAEAQRSAQDNKLGAYATCGTIGR